ncbi:MAG: GNAT family N-acetyltransferase [Acidobacteriota bacterium]
MDQVIIRPAHLGDLNRLLNFEQAIIETERPFDETLRRGADVHYYDLEALISAPGSKVVIAELGAQVNASGYARIESSEPYLRHQNHSNLGFMYVAPEHRGKGINKQFWMGG